MSEHAARSFAGAMVGWFCAFLVILAYWTGSEMIEPGQQYADPLAPCVYLGYLFGTLPGVVVAGVMGTQCEDSSRLTRRG